MSISYEGSWEKRLWQIFSDTSVNSIDEHLSIGVVDDTMRHVRLGEIFHSWNHTTLAPGSDMDTLVITSTKSVSLFFDASVAGDTTFYLFEDTTTTANGTALSQTNRNRVVGGTSNISVYDAPTISTTGTLLSRAELPGGSQANRYIGAATMDTDLWLLKPNSKYLIRLINQSSSSEIIDLQLDYRENYI